jgi:hypothetical protein
MSEKIKKNEKAKKQTWRAGNMLYPVPAVMVSCARKGEKKTKVSNTNLPHRHTRPQDVKADADLAPADEHLTVDPAPVAVRRPGARVKGSVQPTPPSCIERLSVIL